jgi:outer membrane receptor protein involved in Fe transport
MRTGNKQLRIHMKFARISIIYIVIGMVPSIACSQILNEEEGLIRAYGDEAFISIATGSRQLIFHAPAVASVITANDIKAMGATDLDEVLESVPGLHVSHSPRAYSPLYTIRGIYSESNPQVLVLINDVPITNVFAGDRSQVWGGMPINNISRIEIIRGPGSAIYGADAFAGTINIITKTHDDIKGSEFGARAGSFSTQEGWFLHGGSWNTLDIAFALEVKKTDGHREFIDFDAQSGLDLRDGTNASFAPGPVNLDKKLIETRLDISSGDWRLRLGYQGRDDVGTGAGVAHALDPNGSGTGKRFNADLTYNSIISRHWDITTQISYFDTQAKTDLILFPPGTLGPTGLFGAFPEGMIGSPNVYERHARLGVSTFYHGFDTHRVRLGSGIIHNDMYKVEERKNYAPDFSPLTTEFDVIDVSNDPDNVFIRPNDRTIKYVIAQDEWDFAHNWNLTSGIRYDHYSDFGDTTNPRIALIWQTIPDLTTKLLYGRAFRAPAFNELYNINNPVALGNPDLQPEKIDTYELAFNYRYSKKMQTGLNLYRYRMDDIIRFIPDFPDLAPATTVTARNSGSRDGYGAELELRYDITPNLIINGNYAFQKSTDNDTDSRVANFPQHQIYLRADWNLASDWKVGTQLNWVANRKRDITDPRPEIDDYLIADITIRYQRSWSPWEFALSARNVFDEEAFEPSPAPGTIPNDLPLAGRHFFAEARYHFDRFRSN